MLFVLLSALMGGVLVSSMLDSASDDEEQVDQPDDQDEPTRRPDPSNDADDTSEPDGSDLPDDGVETLLDDERGQYVGSDEDDVLDVQTDIADNMSYLWDGYEDQNIPLEIRGGAGNDVLLLSGGGYVARGDEGADRIELGDASRVAVYAGQDDTVVGGTGTDVYVNLSGNAVFVGGGGNDLVHSTSSAALSLGGGNDTFFGLNGGPNDDLFPESVSGDAGDDFLHGGIDQQHLWWAQANDQGNISYDSDTLDGGAGNDTLLGSHGDFLTGGTGADEIIVVLNRGEQGSHAIITDFAPEVDTLVIRYGEDAAGAPDPDFFQSLDHTHFKVSEVDGNTVIANAEGKELVHILGQIGLKIGIEQWNVQTMDFDLVDPSGVPVDAADCAIIIMQQWQ